VLVPTLIGHDLVDAFPVMLDPLAMGGGTRIVRNDGALSRCGWSTTR